MIEEFTNDAFDKLAQLNTRANVKKLFAPNELPLPLRRKIADPTEFPTSALGDLLGPAAIKMQEASQAPMALCGQAVLATACLAAQGHRDIEIDGRRSPISQFFAAVAESGERKTGLDRIATKPARDYEQELQTKFEAELISVKDESAAFEAARASALRKNKTSTAVSKEDFLAELKNLGKEPEKPLSPVCLVDDPTCEGVIKLFGVGQPSIGLFSDEGGRLIGGAGMSEENQLKTAATLSQFWDGTRITRTRAGDAEMLSSILRGKRLTMSLMIQPVVARTLLGNDVLSGQGLLSRTCICWPDSTIGHRSYQAKDLSSDPDILKYNAHLLNVFRAPKNMREGKRNELEPLPLNPSRKAKALWVTFHDKTEEQLRDSGRYAQIRGFGAKAPEHALRFAGALSVINDFATPSISEAMMSSGIDLAQFYLDEALRISHESSESPDLLLAEKLLFWIQNRNSSPFYLAQVYQYGPAQLRSKEKAKKIIEILADHGWIESKGRIEIDDKMRNDTWALRDSTFDFF